MKRPCSRLHHSRLQPPRCQCCRSAGATARNWADRGSRQAGSCLRLKVLKSGTGQSGPTISRNWQPFLWSGAREAGTLPSASGKPGPRRPRRRAGARACRSADTATASRDQTRPEANLSARTLRCRTSSSSCGSVREAISSSPINPLESRMESFPHLLNKAHRGFNSLRRTVECRPAIGLMLNTTKPQLVTRAPRLEAFIIAAIIVAILPTRLIAVIPTRRSQFPGGYSAALR